MERHPVVIETSGMNDYWKEYEAATLLDALKEKFSGWDWAPQNTSICGINGLLALEVSIDRHGMIRILIREDGRDKIADGGGRDLNAAIQSLEERLFSVERMARHAHSLVKMAMSAADPNPTGSKP